MKVPTQWTANPSAAVDQRVYDSGSIVYDSGTLTYDGNVAGQSALNTKVPATWGVTGKTATAWVTNPNIGTVDPYDTTGSWDGNGTAAAIDSYDGLSANQNPFTTKVATSWSDA